MTAHDPLAPHAHEPNPLPPSPDDDLTLNLPDGSARRVAPAYLRGLASVTVHDCYIVSTGHGTSGPFAFSGVRLLDLVDLHWSRAWTQVEVVSADGFGTRARRAELTVPTTRPVLLAHARDGQPLARADGLVRLIVPGEIDDALRQVKWVAQVRVISEQE